jgi:hypothetical protein
MQGKKPMFFYFQVPVSAGVKFQLRCTGKRRSVRSIPEFAFFTGQNEYNTSSSLRVLLVATTV